MGPLEQRISQMLGGHEPPSMITRDLGLTVTLQRMHRAIVLLAAAIDDAERPPGVPPGARRGVARQRSRAPRSPTTIGRSGRVAQRESARFTRERSLVRNQPCPSKDPRPAFVVRRLLPRRS